MKTVLLLILSTFPVFSNAAVFGVDDRVSIRPGSEGYELSRSVAIAVLSSNYESVETGIIKLLPDQLDNWFCPEVRFSKQLSLSYSCTGFLVAPDIIMTAGHCMVNTGESRNETDTYCKAYSWLFDYDESLNPERVDAKNHYACKRVIYAVKDEKAPFRDYALVQLDRPVKGRTPFKLNSAPVKKDETFTMIGYPFGLPAKLSRPAKILVNNPERESFLTNLDAFQGNSGSPVFNAKNEIAGILVGGTPSMNTLTNGRCEILNRCSENGANCLLPDKDTTVFPGYQGVGSEVQRVAPVAKLLEKVISEKAQAPLPLK